MFECNTHTNTRSSTEAKGRAVHQVRFGSRFLVSSHGHNQVPPSLPLFHLLSHSLSLSPACACVSVVCDLVPEVSVSVCPSGLTLTEQWSGEWQRDRLSRSWARGKAAAASINFRFAFQSTAKRVNLTDFLLILDIKFQLPFATIKLRFTQLLFTLHFQGILSCLFTFVATTSRKPNLHILLPLRTTIKLILILDLSGCACFHGYLLRNIELTQEFSAFLYSSKYVKIGYTYFVEM